VSDHDLERMNSLLAQEPVQRERAEKLFRDVLRAAGVFKSNAAQKDAGAGELLVEIEKLEEALLFFKGLSNKYYDVLFQLQRLLEERKMAPTVAAMLLEKRSPGARAETLKA
jgi:hypothetical protein